MSKSKSAAPRSTGRATRPALGKAAAGRAAGRATGRAANAFAVPGGRAPTATIGKAAGGKSRTPAERPASGDVEFEERGDVSNPPALSAEDQPGAVARGVKKAEAAQVAADQLGEGMMATSARERAKVATARARRHSATSVAAAINKAQPERMSRSAARELAYSDAQTRDAEIAQLRRRVQELEEGGGALGEIEEYPKAVYRKHVVDLAHPNGYEVRRVKDADDQKALGKGWSDTPPVPKDANEPEPATRRDPRA